MAQRGLADARRSNETQDRSFDPPHALLHGEVLKNAFLDLLEAVVIFLEHCLRFLQALEDLAALLPGHLDQPVDVVAYDGGFGRHRRHEFKFVELRGGLGLDLFGHAGFLNLDLKIGKLVRYVVHFAELFLNGLHLLIQVILALAPFHLLLDATANAPFDLQYVDFAINNAENVLQPGFDVLHFENFLLLRELKRHMRGDGIGQAARFVDTAERRQHLRRNFLVEFHILLKQRDD